MRWMRRRRRGRVSRRAIGWGLVIFLALGVLGHLAPDAGLHAPAHHARAAAVAEAGGGHLLHHHARPHHRPRGPQTAPKTAARAGLRVPHPHRLLPWWLRPGRWGGYGYGQQDQGQGG